MSVPQVAPRQLALAPWGVSVADVAVLCTTVPILDQAPEGRRPSSTVDILVATVQTWIREVSNMVLGSIGQYQRITDDTRTRIVLDAAKTVVVNGVASYVVSAAFPSAVTANVTSYGQILWQRYKDGLASLMALVAEWIAAGGDGISPVDSPTSNLAGSYFPCPQILDRQPF